MPSLSQFVGQPCWALLIFENFSKSLQFLVMSATRYIIRLVPQDMINPSLVQTKNTHLIKTTHSLKNPSCHHLSTASMYGISTYILPQKSTKRGLYGLYFDPMPVTSWVFAPNRRTKKKNASAVRCTATLRLNACSQRMR